MLLIRKEHATNQKRACYQSEKSMLPIRKEHDTNQKRAFSFLFSRSSPGFLGLRLRLRSINVVLITYFWERSKHRCRSENQKFIFFSKSYTAYKIDSFRDYSILQYVNHLTNKKKILAYDIYKHFLSNL